MKIAGNKKLAGTIMIALIPLVLASSALALPPDPDNAALLYYQVFLICQKPDDTMQDMISDLAAGKIEPDARITKFVESQKTVIELAAAAAELHDCHWGLRYSDGLATQVPYLSQIRELAKLILADAKIAAKNGNCDLAIDRCLTARKLAVHVGSEPTIINLLVEIAIEKIANKCIQDILSSARTKPETLRYLKEQLKELDNGFLPIELYYDTEREVMAMYMTTEKIREALPSLELEDKARQRILAADEQFCQRNRDHYNKHMTVILSSLELPYQQAYAELKSLDNKAAEEVKENPDATLTAIFTPATWRIYNHDVYRKTSSNALKAAIEIYIMTAGTARLPDALPAGLPKDLFSGEDFEYEKKDDGFVLRCRGKDLDKDQIHEYEFRVRK